MKKYDYRRIRSKALAMVKRASYSPDNPYKDTVWQFHILPVVEHSLRLGRKLKADLEVLELSALFHDLAAITDKKYIQEHHRHGANMAEKILTQWGYPREKIIKIKNCILKHRGSKPGRRESLEEKILASADAMSHFTQLADMMYLAYAVHKLKTAAGAIWLKNKLQRSWRKIMPAGRKLIMKDYLIAMEVINKAIRN